MRPCPHYVETDDGRRYCEVGPQGHWGTCVGDRDEATYRQLLLDDLAPIDTRPNFEGHPDRLCGDHRTVGPHRAWCFDCGEWCYPSQPCVRCDPAVVEVRR